jgi:prepilin-type processing-associated H-X9-DG protein
MGPPRTSIFGATLSGTPGSNDGEIEPDRQGPRARAVPSTLQAIGDGMSRTVLLAEQAGKPQQHGDRLRFQFDAGPIAINEGSTVVLGWASTEGAWATAEMGTFHAAVNQDNHSGPYGFHEGANVAMCDGSVRMLHEGMQWEVLSAILTRDGDEIIADGDWR